MTNLKTTPLYQMTNKELQASSLAALKRGDDAYEWRLSLEMQRRRDDNDDY